MLKKINQWIEKKKQKQKKKLDLIKARKYYKIIQSGGLFLKFIYADIEQMKKNQVNRHMRRRFEKALNDKGTLTEEMVTYYSRKTETILAYIDRELHPPKPKKEIDGKKFYDNLKKEENKNAK